MVKTDEGIVKLVKERFMAIPPEVEFSIGQYGDFTREELIAEVDKGSDIGKAAIEMQLEFIRRMPRILADQ